MSRALLTLSLIVACGPRQQPPEAAGDPEVAQADPQADPQAQLSDVLGAYLDALEQHDRWQGSVAITRHGEPVFAHAVGQLQPDDDRPVDLQTRFRIGSITKTYTATIVFQLIEEGRLSLQTPLAEFFPRIPSADRITVEQLLDHHSGLTSLTDAPDYASWATEPMSQQALLDKIVALGPASEPGVVGAYSNTNYVLLGWIIEALEEQPYASVVRARVLELIGTERTGVGLRIDPEQNEARSMRWDGAAWRLAPETDVSIPGGAGALSSTPTELCAFATALFGGELVHAPSLAQMQALDDAFGRGLIRFPFHDRWAWGHTGRIDGFSSMLGYFEDDGVCVAITSHASDYDGNEIALTALSALYGLPHTPPPPQRISLTPEQLKPYVGAYSSETHPLDVAVSVEGGVLTVQATGQPSFAPRPISATTFVAPSVGLRMVFEPSDDGQVSLTLHQGGGVHRFVRRDPE